MSFDLAPGVHHLNHGSFGAVTREVRAAQRKWQDRMERDPMRFFTEDVLPGVDRARARLAEVLGADPEDLVLVRNATEGVSAVLRSLRFEPDDEIVVNDHEYGACVKACLHTGARVVTARIPLPLAGPEVVVERVLAALTPRTRLVLVSHVTSPTGLVFPLETLLEALGSRGVPCLVDGAHAPGMLPLDLGALARRGLEYYTANLHKWMCAPKGAAFLWARRERQDGLGPPSISHGHGGGWPGRSSFHARFDWTGTWDPTPWLVIPETLDAFSALDPGGAPAVREKNRALALRARSRLSDALDAPELAPASMIGSLAAVKLPDDPGSPRAHPLAMPTLQATLHAEGFRVPVSDWPHPPRRLLRVSAHRYNHLEEYEALAAVLARALHAEGARGR